MARPETLIPGNCYFSVGFYDGDLLLPMIDTLVDADEAGKLLSLFAGIGVQPHVDYFANGGRTRVLEFSIPSEHESIVHLCRRVLVEVYSMRRGDVLDYHPLKREDVPPRR